MKYILRLSGLLFIIALLACCDGDDRKISVTDSDDTYEFFAKFDKHETERVQNFINTQVAPSSFSGDHVDVTTTLDDHTKFKLEESPGKVRIELDKGDNSDASYRRIKSMCEGIKKILTKK
ncbi:hypothetical protein GO755_15585 [Spirosoma sp. HMF4905]|uniref:DUF3568 family protein n=1 Tax=Spirosoma arboris TaxID=2682092 RepID=A0A7K1SCC6_9BACT|nr:hypothetical protein [Spirosoma arboris]MVM31467.1 hypothetical protein [Spirosoma arboris]